MREYNEQMEFLRDQGSLFGFDFQKIESLVEKPPEPGKENPPRNNEENIIDKDYFETFPNEALEHLYRILPKSAKLNFKPTLDGILKNRFTPEEIELRSNKRETKIREFREQMKILRDQTSHTVFDLEKIESFLNNYTGVIEDRDLDVDYFQTLDKQTLQNIYEMVPKVSRQIFLNAIKKNILTPVQRQLKRMNDVERKRRQRAAMKMQEFKNQLIAFVGQSSQFEQDFMKIELFLGNSSENNEDRDHILNYFQRFDDLALQQLFKILPTNHKEVIKPIFDIIQFKRYTPDNTGLQEVINIIPGKK
uniref:Uncharacterized protein n=1 Tax=Megaselia scalaris TaxID=36166 RepID=T1GVE7_MEGSC